MKRVFVCSPFRGTAQRSQEENVEITKRLCLAVFDAGHAPWAPHLIYPLILDDDRDSDRAKGIAAGIVWLGQADQVWVFAEGYDDCSTGMRAEIDRALKFALPPEVLYMPLAFHKIAKEFGFAPREARHSEAAAAGLGGILE